MITKFCRTTMAATGVCLAFYADEGRGAPVIFAFEGTVADVQVLVPVEGQTWPDVGASFSGTYTFDSNSMDSSADEFSGVYTTPAPIGGVTVQVGAYELAGGGSFLSTYDVLLATPPHDLYEAGNWLSSMEFLSHPAVNAVLDRNHFQLRIAGNTQLLDGLALPLTPPSLANATEANLFLFLDNSLNTRPAPYVIITGALGSLTLVPEPGAATTIGLGLLLHLASPRRKGPKKVSEPFRRKRLAQAKIHDRKGS